MFCCLLLEEALNQHETMAISGRGLQLSHLDRLQQQQQIQNLQARGYDPDQDLFWFRRFYFEAAVYHVTPTAVPRLHPEPVPLHHRLHSLVRPSVKVAPAVLRLRPANRAFFCGSLRPGPAPGGRGGKEKRGTLWFRCWFCQPGSAGRVRLLPAQLSALLGSFHAAPEASTAPRLFYSGQKAPASPAGRRSLHVSVSMVTVVGRFGPKCSDESNKRTARLAGFSLYQNVLRRPEHEGEPDPIRSTCCCRSG